MVYCQILWRFRCIKVNQNFTVVYIKTGYIWMVYTNLFQLYILKRSETFSLNAPKFVETSNSIPETLRNFYATETSPNLVKLLPLQKHPKVQRELAADVSSGHLRNPAARNFPLGISGPVSATAPPPPTAPLRWLPAHAPLGALPGPRLPGLELAPAAHGGSPTPREGDAARLVTCREERTPGGRTAPPVLLPRAPGDRATSRELDPRE